MGFVCNTVDTMGVFLSAEWRNLINLTYRVPAEVLQPHLPKGVELDLYEGQAHLSLVAFDFANTKVKGIKIPFHVNFPEINLRFYVRSGEHRGVVFIKELVPRFWIAWVAKQLYNEPYQAIPMRSEHRALGEKLECFHEIQIGGRSHSIKILAGKNEGVPPKDSAAHFFKEHDLGYGITRKGVTLTYEVEHPLWETRPIENLELNFDFAKVYGAKWGFLNEMQPTFPLFAVGSAIKVFQPKELDH
jgi:uncharacterized protein